MKIITKKQVEESIDIKVPACFKDYTCYYKITEDGITTVYSKGAYHNSCDSETFAKNVEAIMKLKEVPESEFNEFFANTIENIGLLAGISNVPTLQLQD